RLGRTACSRQQVADHVVVPRQSPAIVSDGRLIVGQLLMDRQRRAILRQSLRRVAQIRWVPSKGGILARPRPGENRGVTAPPPYDEKTSGIPRSKRRSTAAGEMRLRWMPALPKVAWKSPPDRPSRSPSIGF